MLPRLRPGCAEETEASPTGGNAICATSGALRSAGGTRLPMAGRVTAHQASVAEQATTSAISCRSHGRLEPGAAASRSEEHTSELQSRSELVCRLLLEKKKKK